MKRVLWVYLLGLAALTIGGAGAVPTIFKDDSPISESAARIFSPEMRRLEARLGQVSGELAILPDLQEAPLAFRYGFRSEVLFEQDQPEWVQIDLKRSWRIDRIAAVPVHIPGIGKRGEGYGFPLRFRIEVAENPEMMGAVTVVDLTRADVLNPGRFPMDFRIKPTEGRYIRVTSTRHFPVEEGFLWALEELVVLSGNNFVAMLANPSASSAVEIYPNWSRFRLIDGQSALGMPMTRELSPTQGYASAVCADPNEAKWIEVDLGQEYPVDEVCLLPVESDSFETLGAYSFPRGFEVRLSNDPQFNEADSLQKFPPTNLSGYPGNCAIVVPVLGKRGRYVRLDASRLWGTGENFGFALAEMQVYSGNQNVALGKRVQAKDSLAGPSAVGWAPEFLVDGFGSRGRLIEYPHYLDLIGNRGQAVNEQNWLLARRADKLRSTGLILAYGGIGLVIGVAFGLGWLLIRQRKLRAQALAQLRDQIARDLHDDIGSNLGGIVLLGEMGSRHSADVHARKDFLAIKEAAEETSQSMQDIVWLIERGDMGLRDMVAKLRKSVEAILGDTDVTLDVEPADFRDRQLSLFFRRHVFFAFKETLNNVRKHAAATKVTIYLSIGTRTLEFVVKDEGCGFDLGEIRETGHGLANLQRRAGRLKGECEVASRPGHGTRVTFKAPFNANPR